MTRTDIRLALPSKGVLQKSTLSFLEACGMTVYRPNPRQYEATIPSMPGVSVLFQRPGDIAVGVREGSMDLGITGYDIQAEKTFGRDSVLLLHDALGYGPCTLNLAVPDATPVRTMADLVTWAKELEANGRSLRIATKFPKVTTQFLDQHRVPNYTLVNVEGTLEIAPVIGFADMIADLVSSGVTLRDNHLRKIDDGQILASQAVLIGNRTALKGRPEVLAVARQLIEYFEAQLRAAGSYQVTANVRGDSPEAIADRMLSQTTLGGLQGPTISNVIAAPHLRGDANWFAVNIVVTKANLFKAMRELRQIGGSGVIVTPCAYIFEEEPERYRAMLDALSS